MLNSDACATLRMVVRSRIADQLLLVGENSTAQAEQFMRDGALSQEARESIGAISRLSIFLKVLEEITSDIKQKNLTVLDKITIAPN